MKYFNVLLVLLFVASCSGFEFVYNDKIENEGLVKNTKIIISGDDADDVYYNLAVVLGKAKNPKYRIIVNSTRADAAAVVDKDATASKFSIKYDISYSLFNLEKNCLVKNTSIITESTYAAKSAGYSFGTDLSKKETALRSLKKNINLFFNEINKVSELNICNG